MAEPSSILIALTAAIGGLVIVLFLLLYLYFRYEHKEEETHPVAPVAGEWLFAYPDMLYIQAYEKNGHSQCAICLDEYSPDTVVKKVRCQHIFHSACLKKWAQKHDICPFCRQPLAVPLQRTAVRFMERRHRNYHDGQSMQVLEEQHL